MWGAVAQLLLEAFEGDEEPPALLASPQISPSSQPAIAPNQTAPASSLALTQIEQSASGLRQPVAPIRGGGQRQCEDNAFSRRPIY